MCLFKVQVLWLRWRLMGTGRAHCSCFFKRGTTVMTLPVVLNARGEKRG